MPVELEYYNTLRVSTDASTTDIKRAFRALAVEHHPDKGGDPEKFKKIALAYETLSNDEKRKKYDLYGEKGVQAPNNEDIQNIFQTVFGQSGGFPFFDLFGSFNTFGTPFGPPTHSRRPENLEVTCQVSLEELATRSLKKVEFERDINCDCEPKICTECNGRGRKTVKIQLMMGLEGISQVPCSCDHGKKKSCEKCKFGVKQEKHEINLHLTPEMHNRYRYRVENEGHMNADGVRGTLVVKIEYLPHPVFQVDSEMNLMCRCDIPLKYALTGISLTIYHPGGETISYRIEEIIKNGTEKRISGKGMIPKADLCLTFQVIFPTELKEEVKNILREIL